MRRAAEIAAFLGLSAAVHAGVVAGLGDSSGGTQGQGAGGADRVTLQPAPDSLAALAERWTTAPETAPAPLALTAPTLPEPTVAPTPDSAPQRLPPSQSMAHATLDAPSLAQGPAPAPVRPTLPALPSALARPEAEPPADRPNPADSAPTRAALPRLPAPEGLSDPQVSPTAPPPPGSTALATAISPRPSQRPFDAPPRPEAPARASPAASAPQAARVASGQGGGATQGAAQAVTAAPAALSASQRQSLMAQWGGQIRARIERARPRINGSGQVLLALQVARGGQLTGLSVARSSGDPALDEAALSAVRRAGRFPAAPDGLTDAAYAFSLPIRFR